MYAHSSSFILWGFGSMLGISVCFLFNCGLCWWKSLLDLNPLNCLTSTPTGLWCYLQGKDRPCLTLIGSPNFGYRSVHRDLEAQIAIVTENEELQSQLREVSTSAVVFFLSLTTVGNDWMFPLSGAGDVVPAVHWSVQLYVRAAQPPRPAVGQTSDSLHQEFLLRCQHTNTYTWNRFAEWEDSFGLSQLCEGNVSNLMVTQVLMNNSLLSVSICCFGFYRYNAALLASVFPLSKFPEAPFSEECST